MRERNSGIKDGSLNVSYGGQTRDDGFKGVPEAVVEQQEQGLEGKGFNGPEAGVHKCGACQIEVKYNSNCPLCGKHIKEGARAERYPTYYADEGIRLKKLFLFFFVFAGALLLFLDFVTVFQGWSIICVAGLVMLWLSVMKPVFERVGFPAVMLQLVLVIAIFAVVLEFVGSNYGYWPIAYIIPSAVAFGITAILFSAFFRKVKWGEISIYLTILAAFNLCIVLLGLLNVLPDNTLAICVFVYSWICLIAFKYFLSKSFNESFRKKMRV